MQWRIAKKNARNDHWQHVASSNAPKTEMADAPEPLMRCAHCDDEHSLQWSTWLQEQALAKGKTFLPAKSTIYNHCLPENRTTRKNIHSQLSKPTSLPMICWIVSSLDASISKSSALEPIVLPESGAVKECPCGKWINNERILHACVAITKHILNMTLNQNPEASTRQQHVTQTLQQMQC